jgi:hypothetical protein
MGVDCGVEAAEISLTVAATPGWAGASLAADSITRTSLPSCLRAASRVEGFLPGDRDARAFLEKFASRFESDAGGAAGDEAAFAFETIHVSPSNV